MLVPFIYAAETIEVQLMSNRESFNIVIIKIIANHKKPKN